MMRQPGASEEGNHVPHALRDALAAWVDSGDDARLETKLDRFLDASGIPDGVPVEAWWPCLEAIERALEARPGSWPDGIAARVECWLRAALGGSRADGSTVFGPDGSPAGRRALANRLAERLADPAILAALESRSPSRDRSAAGSTCLPPASLAATRRGVLAVLREGWGPQGDLLAIDHRETGSPCRLELLVGGRRLLGPSWPAAPTSAPKLVRSSIEPDAQVVEWSFREGPATVVRTAVLIPGRRLALLAEEREGPSPGTRACLDLASGVEAVVAPLQPAVRLTARGRTLARLLPAGLTAGVGEVNVEGRSLVVTGAGAVERRSWLPLLISWDPYRDRRTTLWKPLTVAEDSRRCPPGVAFAARVSWGRGDGLLIYRSLARPALRSFLGHQTRARFLIGVFTPTGDVLPVVKIEDGTG